MAERPTAHSPLADWLRWQETLNPRAIELGLERVRTVAAALQLPARGPVTLTVAGTNGKGSSATLAAAMLRAAGQRTGLYTSPHLLRYNERVAIDGVPARDEDLVRAFAAIDAARGTVPLTYFEFGTLAALWLFREAGVTAQVLEVGLGGRLDAVNLVDADGALITSIGLDHTDWLGPDRESIGREKAGVLRAGCPAVVAERHPPESVPAEAARLGARLLRLGQDFDFAPGASSWSWHGLGTRIDDLPLPALPGAVQLQNACGVIAALTALRERVLVTPSAMRAALPAVSLPGRLQRIGNVLLDVGHNAEAAAVLADHLRASAAGRRVLLVLGMLADKPVEAYVHALEGLVAHAFLAGLPGPRGLTGAALAARLRGAGLEQEVHADVPTALRQARALAGPQDLIVVAGSFLTVAAAAEVLHG